MKENSTDQELIEIVFQPYGKRITVKHGITVLDAAKLSGVDVTSLCGGRGRCGKCKVVVQKGKGASEGFSEAEVTHLSEEEKKEHYRLACTLRPDSNITVFIPERSRACRQRLQTEGVEVKVRLNPSVRKYFVKIPRPSLQDQRSDEDRLLDALRKQYGLNPLTIDYEALQKLPISVRKDDWNVTVVIWNGNLIMAIEPGNTTDRCFGFAVDIGTTKLAGFLIDLNTGRLVETASVMNPQISYGEDLMSRITYINEDLAKLQELQNAVVTGINEMIASACKQAKILQEEIYEVNAVGNTCMQTLLLGLWPKYLGLSPYPPIVTRGVDAKASWLGIKVHQNANLHHVPIIGGFVGGDNVAAILSSRMLESEETALLIDVGTNTEIDLGNKQSAMTCSCASGPAFEGMHIKHGMHAASGAIEKISVDPKNFEVHYSTVDDLSPVGICGSALIDAVSELLKAGIIDTTGRFNKDLESRCPQIRKGEYGYEFILAFPEETGLKTGIVITQNDIRELQKAKAAIFAGSSILMQRMGVTIDDIDRLVMAGAFGNYVDPESARTIGMYPEVPLAKIKFVGNAAGTGARMMLISREAREKAEKISRKVGYHELSMDPNFATEYAKAMYLPNKDLSRFPMTRQLLQRLGYLPEV